jgi:tRNA modification GTPase
LSQYPANSIIFGKIRDGQKDIDDVLVSFFKSPHSYTGEDVIEISCHASAFIQQEILRLMLNYGARLATPGEFTLRAFLNGKMDLSQAEAVSDLISSSSAATHKLAMDQMRGVFSVEIARLRDDLLNFISLIELELDFSEEDVEFANRGHLKKLILKIQNKIISLIESFQLGNVLKNGVPVSIIGKPNVGKSSLLNVLLNDEKAIVSEIAGTTRDSIEDTINIGGILFRFIDTAGLRKTNDKIESMGVKRTYSKIQKAMIVLLLTEPDEPEASLISQIRMLKLRNDQHLAIVVNKIDKTKQKSFFSSVAKNYMVIAISAKQKKNINSLHDYLLSTIRYNPENNQDVIVTNARHYEALIQTNKAATRVLNGIKQNIYTELIVMDIRDMLYYLGEISGQITNDEILENIFSRFCIGK